MFLDLSSDLMRTMRALEARDERDKHDGTPWDERLRQINAETGKFIALLAATSPNGTMLELGTSAGYSTLWLTLACAELGRKIITVENRIDKIELAAQTFRDAGVSSQVELIHGEAREHVASLENIAFCFLDTDQIHYSDLYELVVPKLVKGGVLIADNAITHLFILEQFIHNVCSDGRVDALVVPIGAGELVCRKL